MVSGTGNWSAKDAMIFSKHWGTKSRLPMLVSNKFPYLIPRIHMKRKKKRDKMEWVQRNKSQQGNLMEVVREDLPSLWTEISITTRQRTLVSLNNRLQPAVETNALWVASSVHPSSYSRQVPVWLPDLRSLATKLASIETRSSLASKPERRNKRWGMNKGYLADIVGFILRYWQLASSG